MIRPVALICFVLILHPGAASVARAATEAAEDQTTTAARSEGQKWELELHVGAIGDSHDAEGVPTLPGPGPPFPSATGISSRRIPSWLFGDGAALANQALTTWPFRTSGGLVPLDPVLSSTAIRRTPATSIGVRLGRRLRDRFLAELSIEYGKESIGLERDAIDRIEATRASAIATLRDFLFPRSLSVTASTVLRERGGSVVGVIGAFNFEPTRRRLSPFLSIGAGVVGQMGPRPSADLRLEYSLRSISPFALPDSLTERDNVAIRYSAGGLLPVLEAGGGLKYSLFTRWTLRLDVKGQFSRNRIRVDVDAVPESQDAGSGAFLTAIATNPAIQFSSLLNNFGLQQFPSTLSGAALRDFVVFDGTSIHTQLKISTGLVWRF